MGYAELLRHRFPDLRPVVEDLFLLEAHQIADLPARVPDRELGAVLRTHPQLHRFLSARCPAVAERLAELAASRPEDGPEGSAEDLAACEQAVVWEIADWIVYQRAPDSYDTSAGIDWTIEAVTAVTAVQDKVVIDAGAGTGRVTFDVAPRARHVFAVEPVAALRQRIRDQAAARHLDNVFAIDGFLAAIPLPAATADVLLTCQSIGWSLPEELLEIERVVKPGGVAVHLFGAAEAVRSDNPLFRALAAAGYQQRHYQDDQHDIRSFHKTIGA